MVVDVQGRPVAGASIEISITSQDYESVTIGQGASGSDGRFSLPLSTGDYGDLGLGVEAAGFERWGWAGYPRGIANERIVLERTIDRAFLDALRTVSDPRERAARVLEVAASDDLPKIEEMFPYLAGLRPDLLALLRAGTASPVQRDGSTPADHVADLLAYWADPADEPLLAPWLARKRGFRAVPADLSGASIPELCAQWRTVHFEREKVKGAQPFNYCGEPILDSTGTHALVLFQVRYAYWGYNMHLVIGRDGERWRLRRVVDHEIQHYAPLG